jgi:hypothetical protein
MSNTNTANNWQSNKDLTALANNGVDPSTLAQLNALKTSNPDQYNQQLISLLGTNLKQNYDSNQNYDDILNQIQSMKSVDPKAYYNTMADYYGHQMGWQVGQNTSSRNAPVQANLDNLLAEAKAAGIDTTQLSNIANQANKSGNLQNQQRIINEEQSAGSGLGGFITPVATIAAMALAPELAPLLVPELGTVGAGIATGALTGATLGGIGAGVTGGNVGKGILTGGATGALGGGITSGVGATGLTDSLGSLGSAGQGAVTGALKSTFTGGNPFTGAITGGVSGGTTGALNNMDDNSSNTLLNQVLGNTTGAAVGQFIPASSAMTSTAQPNFTNLSNAPTLSSIGVPSQALSPTGLGYTNSANSPTLSSSGVTANLPYSSTSQDEIYQLQQEYPQLANVDPRILTKLLASSGDSNSALQTYKRGGSVQHYEHIPEFKTGTTGHYVKGKGDGQSDDIPAMLADGEYVFDADTVAQLGNGSSDAGAKLLDHFRESLREHKRSAPNDKIPPKASPLQYMKEALKRHNGTLKG